ncbi:hypothetical protein ACQ9Y2_20205 [Pseudomonas palleroniana]
MGTFMGMRAVVAGSLFYYHDAVPIPMNKERIPAMPIPSEWEIEQGRKAVQERIKDVGSAPDDAHLTTIFFRLCGYIEALEDQELLSEQECKVLSDEATEVFHRRSTEIRPSKKQLPTVE